VTDDQKVALTLAAMAMAKRHEKQATRKLLVAERTTLRGVREAARGIVDRVTAEAATSPAHLRLHIRHSIPALTLALTTAIEAGRRNARDGAIVDIQEAARVDVDTPDPSSSDHAYAYAAAASLAAVWGSAVLRNVDKATKNDLSVPFAVRQTMAALEPRMRRTAVTETAVAFNEERGAASLAIAEKRASNPQGGPYRASGRAPEPEDAAPPLVRIWSAILDLKVCVSCAEMAGTAVPLGAEFPGGDPPKHPFCRCTWVAIRLWTPISDAKRMWREAA
jgi:hypothetical protein